MKQCLSSEGCLLRMKASLGNHYIRYKKVYCGGTIQQLESDTSTVCICSELRKRDTALVSSVSPARSTARKYLCFIYSGNSRFAGSVTTDIRTNVSATVADS